MKLKNLKDQIEDFGFNASLFLGTKVFKQNANEFKQGLMWHDYVSVMIHEFPLLLVRRYDWIYDQEGCWLPEEEIQSTFSVQVLGFRVYQKIWNWD